MSLLLFGHQHPLYGIVGFRDFAFVLEIVWHQKSHRGGYCTRCIMFGNPKTTLLLSSSEVKGTWPSCLGSNDCERAEICDCDVCWFVASPNSVVPFQRLRISPACGQVSSISISLCCSKNLTVVLLRSVRLWQRGCSSCIG